MQSTAPVAAIETTSLAAALVTLSAYPTSPAAAALPLQGIECEIEKQVREIGRLAVQATVDARGTGDLGPEIEVTREGIPVLLTHRRARTGSYRSLFGDIDITRQTYAQRGQEFVAPLDHDLQLPDRLYSYPLQQRLSTAIARGPFAEAVTSLVESTGQAVALAHADDVLRDVTQDFDAFYEQIGRDAPPASTGFLVAAIDGKGVPMRRPTQDPKPKRQPGQMGPTPGTKREARVAAVYAIEAFPRAWTDVLAESGPTPRPRDASVVRPRPREKRVFASLRKSKAAMIDEVVAELVRRDPRRQVPWVCLTDGDKNLQKIADAAVRAGGEVTLILDYYHVMEYVWDAARALCPKDGAAARTLAEYYAERLLNGETSAVAQGMRQSATKRKLKTKGRKTVEAAARYITRNKEYMKYKEYLARGMPIGSGVVEGTCRHLVKDRMERTGMHWTMDCAEAVLRMRAIEINGDTAAYWEFHIAQEQARKAARSGWSGRSAA